MRRRLSGSSAGNSRNRSPAGCRYLERPEYAKIGKIAYKCFEYKNTEKPFYLYFKFKGATDSYGNTWPHDKYNSQRRSLWYL